MMAQLTYSTGDLLHMRHTPPSRELYDQLHKKLRRNVELNEIVRMPPDLILPQIREESPELPSESMGRLLLKRAKPRQLDGTESEWRYQGRSESDYNDGQPFAAPGEAGSQRNEGFQRFYKAVISPTHVRVTAGGRIVPNTRGSSPTGKQPREKRASDQYTSSLPKSHDHTEQQAFPIPQPGYGHFPPMFPAFAPGMAPAMPFANGPFPMIPWHLGLGMNGGYGMMPSSLGQISNHAQASQVDGSVRGDHQSDALNADFSVVGNSAVSHHPDHFHPSVYNHQAMWPPGNAFYSYGMAPLPGYAQSALVAQPQPLSASANVEHQSKTEQGRQYYRYFSPTSWPVRVTQDPMYVPGNPPLSSIRPSDITEKQIDVLRGSLRFIEDQLQFNRHQIDERGMETQAEVVRRQLEQFEKNHDDQLAMEEAHYPKTNGNASSKKVSRRGLRSQSSGSSLVVTVNQGNMEGQRTTLESVRAKSSKLRSSKERSSARSSGGLRSSKSGSNVAAKKVLLESDRAKTKSLRKPSSLPSKAALAPPFEPRSETKGPEFVPAQEPTSAHETCQTTADRRSEPYLIGHASQSTQMSSSHGTDFNYGRELTPDELRARHMYWGRAPRHLQSGLPKFDGKDFFPPSPVKDSSSGTVSSAHLASENRISDMSKIETAPFHSLKHKRVVVKRTGPGISTQSESLHKAERSTTESVASTTDQRPGSCNTRIGDSHRDSRESQPATSLASCDTGKRKSSSGESDDDKNLLFKGRNSMRRASKKTHNDIWQSMLKKGKSSANVAPGTVSSATAKGVLPHYTGHATASLTPAIANTPAGSRNPSRKFGEDHETDTATALPEKKRENRHPADNSRSLPTSSYNRNY